MDFESRVGGNVDGDDRWLILKICGILSGVKGAMSLAGRAFFAFVFPILKGV